MDNDQNAPKTIISVSSDSVFRKGDQCLSCGSTQVASDAWECARCILADETDLWGDYEAETGFELKLEDVSQESKDEMWDEAFPELPKK